MRRFWRANDFKTFTILLGAFAFVGLATSLTLYLLMSERIWHDARKELLSLARLMSLQVDGDAHEKLVDPSQMDSDLYRTQNERLGKAQESAPGVRFVYTMRRVGDQICFVLDPTPPGDADHDGVEDQSKLLEVYEVTDPFLKRAISSGSPLVADEVYTDKWGTFLSGYAPIRDSKWAIVGVVGVDFEANSLESALADIRNRALIGFFMSVLAGGILAFLLTFRSTSRVRLDSSFLTRAFNRNGGLRIQAVAIGIVVCTMVVGAFSFLLLRNSGDDLRSIDERSKLLHAARAQIERLALAETIDSEALKGLRDETAFQAFPLLLNARNEFVDSAGAQVPGWRKKLAELVEQSQMVELEIQAERESSAIARAHSKLFSVVALLTSVALSLASFLLVRFAKHQQRKLTETTETANRAQLGYRLVVESLPIGFFRFQQGEVTFSNAAFDRQTRRRADQTASDAFVAALSEAGEVSALEALRIFEADARPFELFFSMRSELGEVRYFESKGVPVFNSDGDYEHLVCFNLDITDMVQATATLQQRSNEVEATNERLQSALTDLETNFSAMVMAFVKAIEAKDPYTAGHSERVMRYSVAIAESAGLPDADIELLRKAALVHDVGKIGIPDGILTKPDRLTDSEFEIIKRHVEIGSEMIQAIPLFRDCVPIVRWHHERLDGSGYPDRLAGDEIPTIVRIAAVADAFDAMTSTRAYRKGMSAAVAVAELEKDAANGKLDERFVSLLADIVNRQGVIVLDEGLLAA